MSRPGEEAALCHVCGRAFPERALRPFAAVRPAISAEIEAMRPGWTEGGRICPDDLAAARRAHVEHLLEAQHGEVGDLERGVIEALAGDRVVARNPAETAQKRMTFGDRLADRIARFGGSWTFILGFLAVLATWIGVNVSRLLAGPFDPYPFVLLNLVLSLMAAMQAPVIMMSQRRQEEKDRLRAESDYRVNLKAELEVRQLHDKIDHLLAREWERLAELQRVQIDMLEDARDRSSS